MCKPIIVQKDATILSLFISVNRSTYFSWYLHLSSEAHVTISTASPVVNVTGRELQFSSHVHGRLQIAVTVSLMPDAVDTVT